MSLEEQVQNRISLRFEYLRLDENGPSVPCARGEHQVAAMRRTAEGLKPCPVPNALREALRAFS